MELTDFVEGSSITWTKNPNYWGFDEKFPENRLPYVDEIVTVIMPDAAARIAALRSGQLDMLGNVGDSQLRSIDQVESLQRTDPDINMWERVGRSDNAFRFITVSRPPFDDIRVRRAMQLALDLETIASTYFKGFADPRPHGVIHNDVSSVRRSTSGRRRSSSTTATTRNGRSSFWPRRAIPMASRPRWITSNATMRTGQSSPLATGLRLAWRSR